MGKTTLILDDEIAARAKLAAASEGLTMSEYVEAAIRRILSAPPHREELGELPSWTLGDPPVDVANRSAMDDWFESHDAR